MKKESSNIDYRSLLEDGLIQLEKMQSKLDALEYAKTEPIAIVGMGCRFPGGIDNPEALWRILRHGVDVITEVPKNRWDIDKYYDPNPDAIGKISTRNGGFVNEVDTFDAHFFNISPREATSLDPQQRLLLEVSWQALENSHQVPEKLHKSPVGVFVGICSNDYARKFSAMDELNAYFATGNASSTAAGRLSYFLGLTGPSLAVDTACSSSLVAVHLGCQSLRNQECSLALVGGVNLLLSPENSIVFSQSRMLAPDGRCKTFDAAADGYVRGEGCGVIVLKRLSDAIKNQDNILSVIRGSAVNQDGPSGGLTVPNGLSQANVIRQALLNGGVKPSQVGYIEAHGTGTSLGDPIEVEAIGTVFGESHSQESPLLIGSLKTNMGHLEAAAGIAGLIKVILQLQYQEIVPHLHLKQPNPYINWNELPINVPTQLTPWSVDSEKRIGGVSSFGFSGTNAHIVLEEAPIQKLQVKDSKLVERPIHLLTLSAKTDKALKDLVVNYHNYLKNYEELEIASVCFSANTGRSHFDRRLAILAADKQELIDKLAKISKDSTEEEVPGVCTGKLYINSKPPKIVFLFTGQGSQYVNMGRQLYETQLIFRQTIEQCERILQPYLEKSLLDIVYPDNTQVLDSSIINQTAYTQPALFAIEYALFQLWQSWGIKPDVVMGHSVGEYVAATVAGVFSLEDGLKLIAERGRLMQTLPLDGEMVVIFADEQVVTTAIKGYESEVTIAAINGSQNIVIAGNSVSIEIIVKLLQSQDIQIEKLNVSHAFHSPLMKPMLAAFERKASEVKFSIPHTEIISNITGQPIDAEIATAKYWCRHVVEPVRFAASMEFIRQKGFEIFVEVGPKPTLLGIACSYLPNINAQNSVFLPSLRPGKEDWQQILQSLSKLYLKGVSVNWSGFDEQYTRKRLQLPTYSFQRKCYWVNNSINRHKQLEILSTNNTHTAIVELLTEGNIDRLSNFLAQSGNSADNPMKPIDVLQVLVQKHQQQLNIASIKDLLYRIEWHTKPRDLQTTGEKTRSSELGSWVILADEGGVGKSLGELLRKRGEECILVYATGAYQNSGSGIWNIQPSNWENWERLFQEVNSTLQLPMRGVIHLWSSDIPSDSNLTLAALQQANDLGCNSVLALVRILTKYSPISPRLWLVTRETAPINSSQLVISQASLSGLGKVIASEHPQLWGGIIDLSADILANEAVLLLTEIEDSQGEDYIALRYKQRYVPRLVPIQLSEHKQLQLNGESTYLITGGLGALGLEVARSMIEQGAGNLILISRHNPSIQAQEALIQMQKLGARVIVKQADVCCEQDIKSILEYIKASLPPLRGIIHGAGVLDDGMLLEQNWQRFEKVMAPKIAGSWNLHSLTQNLSLDFFVCFSSAASLLGSPGQGNYAAANTFMDALMHYRQRLGLPGLSINWGPWQLGMAASLDKRYQSRLHSQGINFITVNQGLRILQYLLGQSVAQIGVISLDWVMFNKQFSQNYPIPPFLGLVCNTDKYTQVEVLSVLNQELLDRLHSAVISERQGILTGYLQKELGRILELEQSEMPDPQQGFADMGVDSLMAVELNNLLQKHLGHSLPVTIAFEYSSIKELSKYLLDELLYPKSNASKNNEIETINKNEIETISDTDKLSDNEVDISVATELAKLEAFLRKN